MRDYRDAKSMAQSLRTALADKSITVSNSESLELIAKAFGVDNWNILSAKVKDQLTPAPLGNKAGASKNTLYCSFCGKSQYDIKKLIAGPKVFICDECIGICNGILGDEAITELLQLPQPEAISALNEISTERLLDYRASVQRVLEANVRASQDKAQSTVFRRLDDANARMQRALQAVEAVLHERGTPG